MRDEYPNRLMSQLFIIALACALLAVCVAISAHNPPTYYDNTPTRTTETTQKGQN